MAKYMYSGYQYIEATLFGIIFGLLFAIVNQYSEKTFIRQMSFGRIIAIKSGLYAFGLGFSLILIATIMIGLGIMPDEISVEKLFGYISFKFAISWLLFFILLIFSFNFVIEVNKKFGPGNLWKMIIGRYQKPRDEDRIFMFLDLKDSTGIAEKLGHNKYSNLLKRCFHDITDIVLKYEAEIYQYVGDEVVLSWILTKGLKNSNCIKLFFAYERKLIANIEKYEKEFGFVPEFKAGMDMGQITATEIGEIKREIAYHGDVLNTASRIQHQCKNLSEKILISKTLAARLNLEDKFIKNPVGDITLRGKRGTTSLYSLSYLG